MDNTIIEKNSNINRLVQAIIYIKQIKIYFFFNPKLRKNLGKISDKNFLIEVELISFMYKTIESFIKTSSKMQKLKFYNETINNPIYRSKQKKAINIKL